jgi:hypothetical protein
MVEHVCELIPEVCRMLITVLNYSATLPAEKQKILYADTEQSRFHCQKVLKRILQLIDLPIDKQPEALEFLSLRDCGTRCILFIRQQSGYKG